MKKNTGYLIPIYIEVKHGKCCNRKSLQYKVISDLINNDLIILTKFPLPDRQSLYSIVALYCIAPLFSV